MFVTESQICFSWLSSLESNDLLAILGDCPAFPEKINSLLMSGTKGVWSLKAIGPYFDYYWSTAAEYFRPTFHSESLPSTWKFGEADIKGGRSQWLRGLRHEPSSPARTMGSWVRIPLDVWMLLCVHSVLCRWRPCDGLIPRPRGPTTCV
jgi:hypothetical protein